MLIIKKGASGFGALVQKTRNLFTTKKHQLPTRPMWDDSGRVWTNFHHRWFNDWFLNELAWQPTLFKKIKKYLELEYKIWFERRTSRPKCPTPLHSFYIWLRHQSIHAVSYRWFLFSRSFKWHVHCYLIIWKLPTLFSHAIDSLEARESMKHETDRAYENLHDKVDTLMEIIADDIWCDNLTRLKKEHTDITESERFEIHKEIKDKYDFHNVQCPDEYLTNDEVWDRAEIDYENGRLAMNGGPNYDERPAVVYRAECVLKKYKIKSQYAGDWGQEYD